MSKKENESVLFSMDNIPQFTYDAGFNREMTIFIKVTFDWHDRNIRYFPKVLEAALRSIGIHTICKIKINEDNYGDKKLGQRILAGLPGRIPRQNMP